MGNVGGEKTVGLLGGVMLLTNTLAGPAISLMPVLAKEAGWLSLLLSMLLLATLSGGCAMMLLHAMQRMKGNANFELRVEFSDLVAHYLSPVWRAVAMVSYFGFLTLCVMAYIIQTAQVLDYCSLNLLGCAYGLELWPQFGAACGTAARESTPFGDAFVLPCSFLVIGATCCPLAWLNLSDNVGLQWLSIIGLCGLCAIWAAFLTAEPGFPHRAPVWTPLLGHWRRLLGVLLFNFGLTIALPSWANEKRPGVSVGCSLVLSLAIVVVLYTLIGVLGALAFEDLATGNLFSHLNASGVAFLQWTVIAYPFVQNLTSIPVLSIFIRYNLVQQGWLSSSSALLVSFVLPWLLSIGFYGGKGFEHVCETGGLVFSSVLNFAVPVALFCITCRSRHDGAKMVGYGAAG